MEGRKSKERSLADHIISVKQHQGYHISNITQPYRMIDITPTQNAPQLQKPQVQTKPTKYLNRWIERSQNQSKRSMASMGSSKHLHSNNQQSSQRFLTPNIGSSGRASP